MKKIIYFFAIVTAILMIACSKDDVTAVEPSDISNITSEALPGEIVIKWDLPADENLEYIKISYFDHLTQKEAMRLASVYADSIVIPNTRKKFGEYNFTLQPYSKTITPGKVHTITAVSGAAIASYILGEDDPIEIDLTVDMLYTNAQEPNEGPIENLIDGDINTFFHTAWSVNIGAPHYFQVNLENEVRAINYNFSTRVGNNGGDVKRMKIEGSNDNEEWTEVAVHEYSLQDGSGYKINGESVLMPNEFKHLRFTPLARRGADPINNGFFNMSEFNLFEMTVIIDDPEAE